jgi:uncharacterized protein YutE (UPF0331/DUF86 family)
MLTAGAVIDAEGGSYLERLHDALNIIGLRNRVIHAYDSCSDENIYALLV